MEGDEGSPSLGIGVTLDVFPSSGTFISRREWFKIAVIAGVIASAVPRNIWLETPSGPVAVCSLQVERYLKTSSCVRAIFARLGLEGVTGPGEVFTLLKASSMGI